MLQMILHMMLYMYDTMPEGKMWSLFTYKL